ncbi:MAG TPA: cellulase family glycosylhydrolase [Candidatus Angelobacter sp.]|nr:cellulase family glycosylhydrolase [Candidatus Angelobacter sp.]
MIVAGIIFVPILERWSILSETPIQSVPSTGIFNNPGWYLDTKPPSTGSVDSDGVFHATLINANQDFVGGYFTGADQGYFPWDYTGGRFIGAPISASDLNVSFRYVQQQVAPSGKTRFDLFLGLYYQFRNAVTVTTAPPNTGSWTGPKTYKWLDTQIRFVLYDNNDFSNTGNLAPIGNIDTYDPGDSFGYARVVTQVSPGQQYTLTSFDIWAHYRAALAYWGIADPGADLEGIQVGNEGYGVTGVSADWYIASTTGASPGSAPALYALQVENSRILDSSDRIMTLVGMSYGDYPNDVSPNRFNTGSVSQDALNIRNAGFNMVTLVEEWGHLESSSSASVFTYDSAAETQMLDRINALTRLGIYVMVQLRADNDTSTSTQYDTGLARNRLNAFLGPGQYCNPGGDFLSELSDTFYSVTPAQNSTGGMAHLTRLLLEISRITANNSLVVGYDPMDAPTRCPVHSLASSQIRADWHAQLNTMINTVRAAGDDRIFFVEEAPFFEYYGQDSTGVTFTNTDISDRNWASSLQYYKGEYSRAGRSGWLPCYGDYPTLLGYWNTTAATSDPNCNYPPGGSAPVASLWVGMAEKQYANQAFFVGEFGDIYGNNAGDLGQSWNINATRLFMNDPQIAGWSYWAQGSTGTWTTDIQPLTRGVSVVVGSDGGLYANGFSAAGWTGWESLSGSALSQASLCSSPGRIDLLVRGTDEGIYHKSWVNDTWLTRWDGPGGSTLDRPSCAVLNGDLFVAVRGTDNATWVDSMNLTTDQWLSWTALGGGTVSAPVLVATPSLNRLDLVVRGTDNGIWHMAMVKGVWSGVWDSPGGATMFAPAAVSDGSTLQVVVTGTDLGVWYTSLDLASGSWSG